MSYISIVLSQQSFLKKHPIQLTCLSKFRANTINYSKAGYCSYSPDDQQHSKGNGNELGKRAMGALIFAVLAFGLADGAFAAMTGGRFGGQFFKSSAPFSKPTSFKKTRGTFMKERISFSVTPPVDPPLVGGYGCGSGMPYYSIWGWTPFLFFEPGPCVVGGIEVGIKAILLFMFIGAVAAVVSKYFISRNEDEN